MINELNQEVQNFEGKTLNVVNIRKFAEAGANINILLTAREKSGKTTSALQYVREQYLKHGYKGVHIFNTEDVRDNVRHKLIKANQAIYPQQWKGVLFTKNGLYDSSKREMFHSFVTINNFHKFKHGGRDPLIKTIIYDEFNEGLANLRANQSIAFENILMSCNQHVVVFFLGNRTTMDIPLFADLGIKTVDKELELFHNVFHLGRLRHRYAFTLLVYKPDPDTNLPLRATGVKLPPPNDPDDWRPALSHQLGLYRQSVGNAEDADNTEMVVPTPQQQRTFTKVNVRPRYILFDRLNAEVWIDPQARLFLIKSLRPADQLTGRGLTISFTPVNIRAPHVLVGTRSCCERWWTLFRHKRVYFSDVVVKNKFLQDVVARYARANV